MENSEEDYGIEVTTLTSNLQTWCTIAHSLINFRDVCYFVQLGTDTYFKGSRHSFTSCQPYT